MGNQDNEMKRWLLYSGAALVLGLMFFTTGLSAQVANTGTVPNGVMVTRNFTGIWDQVDQESQGIALQVVNQWDDAPRAVVYWYTYGTDRQSAWYLASGEFTNDRVELQLFESTDVGFMQAADPAKNPVNSIGTMTIVFDSCQSGEVSYDTDKPEVGSGSFRIERLVGVRHTNCSGGLSDDMYADAAFGEQHMNLLTARDGVAGSGHVRYEGFPGHIEFDVTADGLADGHYHLMVGGVDRGEFDVSQGFGEMRFASPAEDGRLLLNFDPRGVPIELHDGMGAVLSSFENMMTSGHHHGGMTDDHDYDCQYDSGMSGMGGMGGMRHCVQDGDYAEIHTDLDNTGTLPEATGHAEWNMNANRVQFAVEIANVPAGIYMVNVAGTDVGTINAVQTDDGVFGRLSFRDPESYGMRHLDFEPRGEWVRVSMDGNVIMQVQFPAE
jgi:hypothetical protein